MPDQMDGPDACLSPHVRSEHSSGEPLAWYGPRSDSGAVRVISWTCDCVSPVFELCQQGGLQFIRRTHQSELSTVTCETRRWAARDAAVQWSRLLAGQL